MTSFFFSYGSTRYSDSFLLILWLYWVFFFLLSFAILRCQSNHLDLDVPIIELHFLYMLVDISNWMRCVFSFFFFFARHLTILNRCYADYADDSMAFSHALIQHIQHLNSRAHHTFFQLVTACKFLRHLLMAINTVNNVVNLYSYNYIALESRLKARLFQILQNVSVILQIDVNRILNARHKWTFTKCWLMKSEQFWIWYCVAMQRSHV